MTMDNRQLCEHPKCEYDSCDYPCVFCLENMTHDIHTCLNVLIHQDKHPQYFTCTRCGYHVKKTASGAEAHDSDGGYFATKWNIICRASRTVDGKPLDFIASGTKVGTFTKEEMKWNTNL